MSFAQYFELGFKLNFFDFRLHRIALEVVADPEKAYASPVDPEAGFVSGGSYLSCFGEKVGVRKAEGPRTPLQNARKGSTSESSTPESGPAENLFDPSSTLPFPGLTTNRGRSQSLAVDGNKEELLAPTTNDGGKVKKLRRATSSIANPIARPATGGRRRGLSTASSVNEATEELATDGAWSQYAGEPGVWTICSTGLSCF